MGAGGRLEPRNGGMIRESREAPGRPRVIRRWLRRHERGLLVPAGVVGELPHPIPAGEPGRLRRLGEMLWWVAQALLPRIKPPYRDTKRIAHARFSLFSNFLQSLSVVQSTPPEGKGIAWRGTVPPQKWMNFSTKALSWFASTPGLKPEVSFEVPAQRGGGRGRAGGDQGCAVRSGAGG
jgi:hypothetical protein